MHHVNLTYFYTKFTRKRTWTHHVSLTCFILCLHWKSMKASCQFNLFLDYIHKEKNLKASCQFSQFYTICTERPWKHHVSLTYFTPYSHDRTWMSFGVTKPTQTETSFFNFCQNRAQPKPSGPEEFRSDIHARILICLSYRIVITHC